MSLLKIAKALYKKYFITHNDAKHLETSVPLMPSVQDLLKLINDTSQKFVTSAALTMSSKDTSLLETLQDALDKRCLDEIKILKACLHAIKTRNEILTIEHEFNNIHRKFMQDVVLAPLNNVVQENLKLLLQNNNVMAIKSVVIGFVRASKRGIDNTDALQIEEALRGYNKLAQWMESQQAEDFYLSSVLRNEKEIKDMASRFIDTFTQDMEQLIQLQQDYEMQFATTWLDHQCAEHNSPVCDQVLSEINFIEQELLKAPHANIQQHDEL